MPLDGVTLRVLVGELNSKLDNGRLMKIYQPESHTIILHFRLPGKNETLLISADPVYPRIHTTTEQPDNPLTPPAFCMLLRKHLEPSRLLTIDQTGADRIVTLRFECYGETGQVTEKSLIFELMGRHSNIFLINADGLIYDAIRRKPDGGSSMRVIMPGEKYIYPPDQDKIDPWTFSIDDFLTELRLLPPQTPIWKWLQNSFQGFSKTAAQEVVRRGNLDPSVTRSETTSTDWHTLASALRSFLDELDQGGVPTWHKQGKEDLTGYALTTQTEFELFPSVNTLADTFFTRRIRQVELRQQANYLRRQINRHLKRVKKKEVIQENTLKEAANADEIRHLGELLTANVYRIQKGQSSVEVVDYTKPEQPTVVIELDPSLTPSQNAQRLFKNYTKAKNAKKITARQLKKTKQERNYLEELLLHIDLADKIETLQEIEIELIREGYIRKPRRTTKSKQKRSRPEKYRSSDGLTILVGRNNRQNDELTFKTAKPNHLWFHAQNIPGSHVVVLAEGIIPETTILEAANLAAYFSKAKSSPKVPVDYTERRHVRKPAGAKPGFVLYDHVQTILVDPTTAVLPEKIE